MELGVGVGYARRLRSGPSRAPVRGGGGEGAACVGAKEHAHPPVRELQPRALHERRADVAQVAIGFPRLPIVARHQGPVGGRELIQVGMEAALLLVQGVIGVAVVFPPIGQDPLPVLRHHGLVSDHAGHTQPVRMVLPREDGLGRAPEGPPDVIQLGVCRAAPALDHLYVPPRLPRHRLGVAYAVAPHLALRVKHPQPPVLVQEEHRRPERPPRFDRDRDGRTPRFPPVGGEGVEDALLREPLNRHPILAVDLGGGAALPRYHEVRPSPQPLNHGHVHVSRLEIEPLHPRRGEHGEVPRGLDGPVVLDALLQGQPRAVYPVVILDV
mmetsp:Transcript_1979/g.7074  ORF Transcript_1979/g.7074 Transcript_1979/m.7074 type:complete len:326 (-) Transcript_1979:305-1282(-)